MQITYTEKEKEALLIEHDKLIKYLANKYMDLDWGFDDTYQELCMLFVKMLGNYDSEKGKITTLFYRYVSSWFTGALMQSKYAKKRLPYGKVTSIDKLSHNAFIKNGGTEKTDFFDFMVSPLESPDRANLNENIISFIVDEVKKLPKPGIVLGVLFHGKTMKDLEPVYDITHYAIRNQYDRNINRIKIKLEEYLTKNKQINQNINGY